MRWAIATLALLLGGGVFAQESTSFKLSEHTFNAGGSPQGGIDLTSTSFRLTLSAIGDSVTPATITSASFSLNGGLVGSYPPPGEVANLRFTDSTTLMWDVEPSVGIYNLYQGDSTNPFGGCQPPGIITETTTFSATPAIGEALFVLLTAENLLAEEGTKGFTSAAMERPNPTPCP